MLSTCSMFLPSLKAQAQTDPRACCTLDCFIIIFLRLSVVIFERRLNTNSESNSTLLNCRCDDAYPTSRQIRHSGKSAALASATLLLASLGTSSRQGRRDQPARAAGGRTPFSCRRTWRGGAFVALDERLLGDGLLPAIFGGEPVLCGFSAWAPC